MNHWLRMIAFIKELCDKTGLDFRQVMDLVGRLAASKTRADFARNLKPIVSAILDAFAIYLDGLQPGVVTLSMGGKEPLTALALSAASKLQSPDFAAEVDREANRLAELPEVADPGDDVQASGLGEFAPIILLAGLKGLPRIIRVLGLLSELVPSLISAMEALGKTEAEAAESRQGL